MVRSFSIIRELSREEIDRHQRRFTGVTTTAPSHITTGVDEDGDDVTEYVCNVRIGFNSSFGLIKDVLISQEAYGIVGDMNVPVLMERSEAGRVTIIGRSQVNLPDIVLNTYTYDELNLSFMNELHYDADSGNWLDGYGHLTASPVGVTGQGTKRTFSCDVLSWGVDFVWASTPWGATECTWTTIIVE